MIYLGKIQDLKVIKITDNGVYLSADTAPPSSKQFNEDISLLQEERILLPKKEVPEAVKLGDIINVFVYKDSEDRPISTVIIPPLTLGGLAKLKVAAVNNIGAFLNWGLLKDLFLPYKEQTYRLSEGDEVLTALYIDKSRRLCATMKIYEYLSTDSPYQKDDKVTVRIYEIINNFGAFAAADDKYSALIPNKELYGMSIKAGDIIEARISAIHEDGKINLSIREKSHIQMDADSSMILSILQKTETGFLPYHDKSDPDDIKKEFALSKNSFKKAIGRLMKNGSIDIKENGIYIKK